MIFINNKYTKYYYLIINKAKSRINSPDDYVENHHIIPKSFFKSRSKTGWLEGDADLDNTVDLTAREHMVCHVLLTKMVIGKGKTQVNDAAWLMTTAKRPDGTRYRINSNTYARIREEHSINARQLNLDKVKNGTHPWQNPKHHQKLNDDMLSSGTHPFQLRDDGTSLTQDRITSGNHPWVARENGTSLSSDRVKNGTHQGLRRPDGTSIAQDQLKAGVHAFQTRLDGSSLSADQVKNGTHNLLGPDMNKKLLAEGRHPSQIKVCCIRCRKEMSANRYKTYHGQLCVTDLTPKQDKRLRKISVNGEIFESLTAASIALNMKMVTLSSWTRKKTRPDVFYL